MRNGSLLHFGPARGAPSREDIVVNTELNAIVGSSPPIRQVRDLIALAAPTTLPVLIQGPTGAGKELVAAALHAMSGRRGRLVAFNVCAIGDAMFEDALFGHVRGAFTGAVADSQGLLREADHGTVFLDEISGLNASLQVKLLRALEHGQFRPVGARSDCRSEFRVIAATNEEIGDLVDAGRFRADLAHRLGGIVIRVPALADRRTDIPCLVEHFLRPAHCAVTVSDAALLRLVEHPWPGNVRELRQVVEWAAVLASQRPGGRLDADVVDYVLGHRGAARPTAAAADETQLFARRDWWLS